MPPIPFASDSIEAEIKEQVASHLIVIYSKTTCPFCDQAKSLISSLKFEYFVVELDTLVNGAEVQRVLESMTGQRTVPNIFINGEHIGGCSDLLGLHKEGKLLTMLSPPHNYEYDLIVIGGGSGGLAAAKEAASLGKKVACLDFVKPSPRGTTWGLGGTCVNVGCIPKKLMHQTALLRGYAEDAKLFGWEMGDKREHNWSKMVAGIQDHIGSLNWNYRVQLRNEKVDYVNSYAEFVDQHTIKATNKKGTVKQLTSSNFIIATGGRPTYPTDCPGAMEYGITSDDLFSLSYNPGKTLLVGASYVSLECAGFLRGLGLDVTVMVRSILLRGFDQQMAEKIGEYMSEEGIKFIRPCVPKNIEKVKDGSPGLYTVTGKYVGEEQDFTDNFNTIVFAIGRDPCTKNIGLEKLGVQMDKKGFITAVDDNETTNVPGIYAVGDILAGKPELTPVAIHAGRMLVRRLFSGGQTKTEYDTVPTTIFTPLEYGCIGLPEEDAKEKYGEEDLEVYHSGFWPLEWTVAKRKETSCYAKLICVKSLNEKVVGFHYLGPNAGEVTQGFALGMKLGANKQDFDATIGIHPTCAEVMNTLRVTKASGGDITAAGC